MKNTTPQKIETINDDIVDAVKELTKIIKELVEKVEKIYVKTYKAGKF